MATPAPMTTTKSSQAKEHPVETLADIPAAPSTAAGTTEGGAIDKPPASSTNKKDNESGETKEKVPVAVTVNHSSDPDDGASVTITQKKIRRAERFGMPVQLSEEEKRSSRAERFGTAPGPHGSYATKKAEELKRKARAERFGITQSMSTDEEEKKKARLARFAAASGTDPLEEQKKKARALRFSGMKANENGKIETKATVVGKAGGEA